jgi:hypothetical protein
MGSEAQRIERPVAKSNVVQIRPTALKMSTRAGAARVTPPKTRARSGRSGPPQRPPFTCTKAYKDMVESVRNEGIRLARLLGFAPGRDLSDRVNLEDRWWGSECSPLGNEECEAIRTSTSGGLKDKDCKWLAKEGAQHHRVAVLAIIRMLLEPDSDIHGMGPDWFDTFDDYLEVARHFVKTAAPGPSKRTLREYAVLDRNQRKIAELEEEAEAKIAEIRASIETERKRRLLAFELK